MGGEAAALEKLELVWEPAGNRAAAEVRPGNWVVAALAAAPVGSWAAAAAGNSFGPEEAAE